MAKEFSILHNAQVMPLTGTMDSFVSGVFHNGVCLPESLIEGRSSPSALAEPTRHLAGTYLFGGYLFGHFGHFIVESLAYLHIIRQCGNFPILFMRPPTGNPALNKRLFRFLEIFNDIIYIEEPALVEKCIIGPVGSRISPPFYSDAQIAALGRFPASRHKPGEEKIWLSRSEFRYGDGSLENEAEIEKTLKEWGWEILHPEYLPIEEQVRRISTASHVAGLDGSAFYSALFADAVHGSFSVFSRRKRIPPILRFALSKKTDALRTYVLPLTRVSGEWPDNVDRLDDPERILGVLRGI